VMVESVHLGREEQRVVVPKLQQMDQPQDERDTHYDQKPDNRRRLTVYG
jgi:hypothetical protein